MNTIEQKVRAIRNYCNKQGLLGCFNYDGTCKLCHYCEELHNFPVSLWDNDYIGHIDENKINELYCQIKED